MMKRYALLLAFVLLALSSASAQEVINLSAPETKPNNTKYRIGEFSQTFDDPDTAEDEGTLTIILVGEVKENGKPRDVVTCVYRSTTNPTGTFLNNGLNKANLSTVYAGNATTGSQKQRVAHRLIVMGESAQVCNKTITGSLSGNPQ